MIAAFHEVEPRSLHHDERHSNMPTLPHRMPATGKFRMLLATSCAAFLLAAPTAFAAVTEQLVDLVKPNGTTLRYLLTTDPGAPPSDTGVVLFAGSQGQVGLASGIPNPGSNFLVRSRHYFSEDGLTTATYDPSPDLGALSDRLRSSKEHADEVAMILADMRKRTGLKKIYLVGTSRGTISAANVAVRLPSDVDGVVLTSTVFSASRGGGGLQGFDFSTITQPLLFVHHVSDACKVTSPGYAHALDGRYPVIWVEGSDGSQGDACGPFSNHGYLGREAATVHAISAWILRRQLTHQITANTPPGEPPK